MARPSRSRARSASRPSATTEPTLADDGDGTVMVAIQRSAELGPGERELMVAAFDGCNPHRHAHIGALAREAVRLEPGGDLGPARGHIDEHGAAHVAQDRLE